MINLEQLEKLLEVTLFTGYIKDERPVSLLIIAKPESGKTELVKKAKRSKGILYLTDATAWGIINSHWDDIESRKVRHIIIPDLTVPLGKATETRQGLTRFLSALIEEGAVELQSYVTNKKAKVDDLRCGLISTITPDALRDQRGGWRKFGFMSRMLPVSYSYSTGTVNKIFDSICSHQYRIESPLTKTLPDQDIVVTVPDYNYMDTLRTLSRVLANVDQLYGFRYQRQLQTLMMASALYDGRTEVNKEDLDFVESLTFDHFNLDCRPI